MSLMRPLLPHLAGVSVDIAGAEVVGMDIVGVDIVGVDIVGVDIAGMDVASAPDVAGREVSKSVVHDGIRSFSLAEKGTKIPLA